MRCAVAMILVLTVLFALTGCSFKSGDLLYSLPEAPEEYYNLQTALDQVLNTGAEYAAPVNGSNRQPTQSVDLDSDGENEVVAFFRREDNAQLEMYIFDEQGRSFTAAAVIEGSGTAVDSVEYVQLDDQPGLEIIVGWQVSESAQYMCVYSLRDWRPTEMMSASYSEYCTVELDKSGLRQIFLIKFDTALRTGTAQLYAYDGAQLEKKNDAPLSTGVDALKRIITGYIEEGTPAVFVSGTYGDSGIITDVFTLRGDDFVNICMEDGTGVSSQTVRNYYVYAADIDDDQIIELPQARELPAWPADSTDVFCLIDWQGLRLNGTMHRKLTTFHNYAAGWYLQIPEEYCDAITVYRQPSDSGLWTYVFAAWDEQTHTAEPLFEIQAFGGDDRRLMSRQTDLIQLGEISDVLYMARLVDTGISADTLTQNFKAIRTDWNSGEM